MAGEANIWNPRTLIEISADTKSAEEKITAIAAQTLFTLTEFIYVVGTGALEVHKNGLLLTKGTDWVEQTGTTFSLTSPATAGDVLVASGHIGITAVVDVRDTDIYVANYQAIRDYAGTEVTVYAQGSVLAGDLGNSFFQKKTGAAPGFYVDNGVTVLVPTGGDGSVGWVGKPDGSNFEGVANAIAALVANPDGYDSVETLSYRTKAECTSLSISYPDEGGAKYSVVAAATGTADGGGFIDAGTKQLKLAYSDTISVNQFGALGKGTLDNLLPIQAALDFADITTTVTTAGGVYNVSGKLNVSRRFDLNGAELKQTTFAADTVNIQFGGGLYNGSIYTQNGTGTAVDIDGSTEMFIGRNLTDIMDKVWIHGSKVNQATSLSKGIGLKLTAKGGGTLVHYISGISASCDIQFYEVGIKLESDPLSFINSNWIRANINSCLYSFIMDSALDGKAYNIVTNTFELNIQPRPDTLSLLEIAGAHNRFTGTLWDVNSIADPSSAVQFIETIPAAPNAGFVTCIANTLDMFGGHTDRCSGQVDTNNIVSNNNDSTIKEPFNGMQYDTKKHWRKVQNKTQGTSDTFNYIQAVDSAITGADQRFLGVYTKSNRAAGNLGGISPDATYSVSSMFKANSEVTRYSGGADWVQVALSLKEGAFSVSSITTDMLGIKFLGSVRDIVIDVREAGESAWTEVFAHTAGTESPAGFNKREVLTRMNPFGGSSNQVNPVAIDGLRIRFYDPSQVYEIENIFLMSSIDQGVENVSPYNAMIFDGNLNMGFQASSGVIFKAADGGLWKMLVNNAGTMITEVFVP
mgnify:CR=1 FL=1|tara:strand:+ start:696 stop:3113 length:2418 start_codon:yes stop_codon:yes gene_type:complete